MRPVSSDAMFFASQDLSVLLDIFDRKIHIRCTDAYTVRILQRNYWPHIAMPNRQIAELEYTAGREPTSGVFCLRRFHQPVFCARDFGKFLFLFDKNLVIDLQRLRPDLYFLHAAVVASPRQAVLLVGSSGSGKSTLAHRLCQAGFMYLSDELAPINFQDSQVYAFLRALCLKNSVWLPRTRDPFSFRTSRGIYIPAHALTGGFTSHPMPVTAIVFVGQTTTSRTRLRSLGVAEAGARLYSNTLNALAHRDAGLDDAIQLASTVPCFLLESCDPDQSERLVQQALSNGESRCVDITKVAMQGRPVLT